MIETVLGQRSAPTSGIVLPHEHLFNALPTATSPLPPEAHQDLVHAPVGGENQWRLRVDPYCNLDNVGVKEREFVEAELHVFASLGGALIVDVTGSADTGRDPEALASVARATGVDVVMATGPYLETAEPTAANSSVEKIAESMIADLTTGAGESNIRAGLIGEVGVSPRFTNTEKGFLIAAAEAHRARPDVAVMVHLPGWLRRGHEVVDLLTSHGVPENRIVLAHMDPSGRDPHYQTSLAERGVWLEFDMIGMGITFPGEGRSPDPSETSQAIAQLIKRGHSDQLLLSHDLFLKQMWTARGGDGLTFISKRFRQYLEEHDIDDVQWENLTRRNPLRMIQGDAL